MKPIPAEEIIDGLSEELQDLLVREAYVRKRKESLLTELEERRKKQAGLEQTRPAFLIFRGKEAKDDFKSVGLKLHEEIAALEKALAGCDLIFEKSSKIIEAELERYFKTHSEDFRNGLSAQVLIPDWERALGLYQIHLKRLVMTLGIARNQMSSGYDRKTGTFSAGAIDAFSSALTAAKALESEVPVPNQLAKRYRELLGLNVAPDAPLPGNITPLPYLANHDVAKQVAGLKTATFELAHSRISALLEECEKIDREGIPHLREELAKVRASQESDQKGHITGALVGIRAKADSFVDAEKMDEVWASMEARFLG